MNTNVNEIFARLTESLSETGDIDIMYYDIKYLGDIRIITYNIVTSYTNINENKELFKKIIVKMEIIKQLLNSKKLIFNFNIRNRGTFNINKIDTDNIVFAKDEIIKSKVK